MAAGQEESSAFESARFLFNGETDDGRRECPYDPEHKLRQARFGNHVLRCRAQYERKLLAKGLQMQLAECRWNKTHEIPLMELEQHEKYCRSVVPNYKYMDEGLAEVARDELRKKKMKFPEMEAAFEEENWEEELKNTAPNYCFAYPKLPKEQVLFTVPVNITKEEKKTWQARTRGNFKKVATEGKFTLTAPSLDLSSSATANKDASSLNARFTSCSIAGPGEVDIGPGLSRSPILLRKSTQATKSELLLKSRAGGTSLDRINGKGPEKAAISFMQGNKSDK